MEALTVVLTVLVFVCTVVFAFVVYSVLAMALEFLLSMSKDSDYCMSKRLIMRCPPRVLSALLALCFLAMVL